MKPKERLQIAQHINNKIISLEESKVVCGDDDSAGVIDKAIADAKKLRIEIISEINSISDMRLSSLLLMRYVNGYTFEECAEALGYDFDYTVTHLHKLAIDAYSKTIGVDGRGGQIPLEKSP